MKLHTEHGMLLFWVSKAFSEALAVASSLLQGPLCGLHGPLPAMPEHMNSSHKWVLFSLLLSYAYCISW